MLAYAPHPGRAGSPRTLLLVAIGHVAALALVLTASSEFITKAPDNPPDVTFIDPIKPPPPPPPDPRTDQAPIRSSVDRPLVIIPTPTPTPIPLDDGPPIPDRTPFAGNAAEPTPLPLPEALPPIVRKAARFITPADSIRPPYPDSKRRLGEGASLRLSLSIDERGRVTAVAPVGAADPVFLEAARRHILKRWRYAAASEGGTAIASRITVTLRFELEE